MSGPVKHTQLFIDCGVPADDATPSLYACGVQRLRNTVRNSLQSGGGLLEFQAETLRQIERFQKWEDSSKKMWGHLRKYE